MLGFWMLPITIGDVFPRQKCNVISTMKKCIDTPTH